MKVFLLRHAIAHERDRKRWPDDSLRPLTAMGKRRFRRSARALARLLPDRAPILTSPFVRTRETAGILVAVHGGRYIACPELAPGEEPRALFTLLRSRPGDAAVLVGHEPDLGRFLVAALGIRGARIAFKKGGAACLEFGRRVAPGTARLHWFATPKLLRAVAK